MTMKNSANNQQSTIAWCGWSMAVPSEWRPLQIRGELKKGSMMIGDSDRPLLLVQWRRVESADFDAQAWLKKRFKKQHSAPDDAPPQPRGFSAVAWTREIALRENESKSAWYGYSEEGGLLLELVTTNLTQDKPSSNMLEDILPGLKVTAKDEPCRWSLYDVGFVSPAGFELVRRHLFSGDIALGLAKGKQEGLLLRQVYPAALAVGRRPLERWLEETPFKERRRPLKVRPNRWNKNGMNGILRRGRRRLPSPLGWCNSRYSTAIAAVDERLDRVLIAEHLTPKEHGTDQIQWCVENMNN